MSETHTITDIHKQLVSQLSSEARKELDAMGLSGPTPAAGFRPVVGRAPLPKRAMSAPAVLNEAYDYAEPASFTRGMHVELPGATMLFLSGTASVDEQGRSVHPGDFAAQCLRTYRNLTQLLTAEGASWHDIVRTSCYLRDIERDYDEFNQIRTMFFQSVGLNPLPASTGIQARLCRSDLLVEIEAIAMIPRAS